MSLYVSEKYLRLHLKLSSYYSCLDFNWDVVQGRVVKLTQKASLRNAKLWRRVHAIYLVLMLLSIIGTDYSTPKRIEALLFFSIHLLCALVRNGYTGLSCGQLLNSLALFEKQIPKIYGTKLQRTIVDKIIVLTQPVAYYLLLPVSFFVAIFLYIRPCQPPFLGSLLLTCTSKGRSDGPLPLRLLIISIEFLIFSQAIIAGVVYIQYIVIAGICSMYKYAESFKFRVGNLEKRFLQYRTLQLTTELLNDCIKHSLFPACVLVPPAVQVLASFACLKLRSEVQWPVFGLFPIILVTATTYTMTYLLAAAKVFVATSKIIERFGNGQGSGQNKMWRRMVKSIRPLRIHFKTNYVDGCTPLTVQDFCVREIASLLVYTDSK